MTYLFENLLFSGHLFFMASPVAPKVRDSFVLFCSMHLSMTNDLVLLKIIVNLLQHVAHYIYRFFLNIH